MIAPKDMKAHSLAVGDYVVAHANARLVSGEIVSIGRMIDIEIQDDNFEPKSWAKSHYGDGDTLSILKSKSTTKIYRPA